MVQIPGFAQGSGLQDSVLVFALKCGKVVANNSKWSASLSFNSTIIQVTKWGAKHNSTISFNFKMKSQNAFPLATLLPINKGKIESKHQFLEEFPPIWI